LVKDHDHLTEKAREWICDSRNTGLGRFKDDITTLQKVMDYLKNIPEKVYPNFFVFGYYSVIRLTTDFLLN